MPGSPNIRSAGILTPLRMTSRVGEPRGPIFRSRAPKLSTASPASTTNALIPGQSDSIGLRLLADR